MRIRLLRVAILTLCAGCLGFCGDPSSHDGSAPLGAMSASSASSSQECQQYPKDNASFRVVRKGCRFGYVADAKLVGRFVRGAWDPSDAVIEDFERFVESGGHADQHQMSAAFGRQYSGTYDTMLYVVFFCPGDPFPYDRRLELGPHDNKCIKHVQYDVVARRFVR